MGKTLKFTINRFESMESMEHQILERSLSLIPLLRVQYVRLCLFSPLILRLANAQKKVQGPPRVEPMCRICGFIIPT